MNLIGENTKVGTSDFFLQTQPAIWHQTGFLTNEIGLFHVLSWFKTGLVSSYSQLCFVCILIKELYIKDDK